MLRMASLPAWVCRKGAFVLSKLSSPKRPHDLLSEAQKFAGEVRGTGQPEATTVSSPRWHYGACCGNRGESIA
jgi:hypothetical protein